MMYIINLRDGWFYPNDNNNTLLTVTDRLSPLNRLLGGVICKGIVSTDKSFIKVDKFIIRHKKVNVSL